jgi:hypothetical protein
MGIKGFLLLEEIQAQFFPVFEKLKWEVVAPLEEKLPSGPFVWVQYPLLSEDSCPNRERLLKAVDTGIFEFEVIEEEAKALKGLGVLLGAFLSFMGQCQLEGELLLYYGRRFEGTFKALESLPRAEAVQLLLSKNLKNKNSFEICLNSLSAIGVTYPICHIQGTLQDGMVKVKGEGFDQIAGLFTHIFEAKS